MNIERGNTIDIYDVMKRLSIQPSRENEREAWYLSPWRDERTPSFKIHKLKNVWYDFGEGEGGDTVAFASKYLKASQQSYRVTDALQWLENVAGILPAVKPVAVKKKIKDETRLVISDITDIDHKLLVGYLQDRGISMLAAQRYLKQLRIYNKKTKKFFFALGFQNEEGGYEARNPFFQSCFDHKDITFIRGRTVKPAGIHLFEGFMDFLSLLEHRQVERLNDDVIVLNSVGLLQTALPFIKGYGYRFAYSWLDNDNAGNKATQIFDEFCKTEDDIRHRPMNSIYAPHKDVNAWHMHRKGLGELHAG